MMRKGAEMGHFELIGSTIVLLFKKGHIDLLPEIKDVYKRQELLLNHTRWIFVLKQISVT